MRDRFIHNRSPVVGVVTEAEVNVPGLSGEVLVQLLDGKPLDERIVIAADMAELPGQLVIITTDEAGHHRYHWGTDFAQRAKSLTQKRSTGMNSANKPQPPDKPRRPKRMTEEQFRQLPGADRVPLYDADDPLCATIEQCDTSTYLKVREAVYFQDALSCLQSGTVSFRGGVRFSDAHGERFVCAYFWLRIIDAPDR